MKINKCDMDLYLKGIEVAEEDKASTSARVRPSIEAKHVKNGRKVMTGLKEISSSSSETLYSYIKSCWMDSMDRVMTSYRGNTKTAEEVFEEVDKLALSFDEMGLQYGDHIVLSMSQVPELLIILLAASKCGLIVNSISDKFNQDYVRAIFKQTPGKKLFITTDDRYSKIADLVNEAGFKDTVVVSLVDSLKDGIDPFDRVDYKKCKFTNRIPLQKRFNRYLMSYDQLLNVSLSWDGFDNGFARRQFYSPEGALVAPLTITYSVGADGTKRIVHSNKSYITGAKFSEDQVADISKMTDMLNLIYLPTHSNSNFSTMINALAQKGAIAFEPIYDAKFLLSSCAINRPTNIYATNSCLLEMCMQTIKHDDIAEYALASAVLVSAIDELPSKKEEKFINDTLSVCEAGTLVLPRDGKTTLSITYGLPECGNQFFTLFKDKKEKNAFNEECKANFGLTPLQSTSVAVLDENGSECGYDEYGRLVLRTASPMLGYLDSKHNRKIKLMDNDGRVWIDTNLWGAILKNGNVVIKDNCDDAIRLSNGQIIPLFTIKDKISEVDEVLSCEVVPDQESEALVAHIAFSPEAKICEEWLDIMMGVVEQKCQDSFSSEICDKIVYIIRPKNMPFQLTGDGKRSICSLRKEGITNAIKPVIDGCEVEIVPAEAYFPSIEEIPFQKVKTENE